MLGAGSSPGTGGRKRFHHLHIAASLAGITAGAALTVMLISSGETAQDPRAVRGDAAAAVSSLERNAGGELVDETISAVFDAVGGGLHDGRVPRALPTVPATSRPTEIVVPGPAVPPDERVTVASGDTLTDVIASTGIDRTDAHNAATALATVEDPRRLQPGQELTLSFAASDDGSKRLQSVAFHVSAERDVVAIRGDDDGFAATEIEHPLETLTHIAKADIDDSLFLAADRAGVPMLVILELIQLYSFDVDFQRDIQPGDKFEVMFRTSYTEDGQVAKYGDVLYARLRVGGEDLPLYRFETADGDVDYYNKTGHSARKALMKTPVDGARLSSRFGPRRHPILGYTKIHRGIDFAAPQGTPVMAAGNGKIDVAGRNGTYGKYVRIRHNGEFKTAYAHLSRIAPAIRAGTRVRQGQIIGYVGSTGRSTGPHLHYEIHRQGKQINPLTLKLPSGRQLKGRELAEFQSTRQQTDSMIAEAKPMVDVASAH